MKLTLAKETTKKPTAGCPYLLYQSYLTTPESHQGLVFEAFLIHRGNQEHACSDQMSRTKASELAFSSMAQQLLLMSHLQMSNLS